MISKNKSANKIFTNVQYEPYKSDLIPEELSELTFGVQGEVYDTPTLPTEAEDEESKDDFKRQGSFEMVSADETAAKDTETVVDLLHGCLFRSKVMTPA